MNSCHPVEMLEVESVPSKAMLLVCCVLFPGLMFKKTNEERRVQSLQTTQSDPLNIRDSPHLKVPIRIYWYLKVRECN